MMQSHLISIEWEPVGGTKEIPGISIIESHSISIIESHP